jgi:hypothetical protein
LAFFRFFGHFPPKQSVFEFQGRQSQFDFVIGFFAFNFGKRVSPGFTSDFYSPCFNRCFSALLAQRNFNFRRFGFSRFVFAEIPHRQRTWGFFDSNLFGNFGILFDKGAILFNR